MCDRRHIEPTTVLFEGDDPRAYIISSNIARRHMSKGQQAMAVAMMYPEPAKTKRKGSGSLEPKETRNFRRSNLFSCLCRRVVDLHKPGQLGGVGYD